MPKTNKKKTVTFRGSKENKLGLNQPKNNKKTGGKNGKKKNMKKSSKPIKKTKYNNSRISIVDYEKSDMINKCFDDRMICFWGGSDLREARALQEQLRATFTQDTFVKSYSDHSDQDSDVSFVEDDELSSVSATEELDAM